MSNPGTAVAEARPTASVSLLAKIAARYSVDPNKLMATLKATAFKQQKRDAPPISDEQMMALLIVADQYKLNPFTKEIYAYPDKQNGIVPVVSVDGWTRIVNEHEQFDGVEFEYGPAVPAKTLTGQTLAAHEWVTAKIYRKDRSHPICLTEYLDEVYRPPFEGKGEKGPYTVNGPWQSHTKRLHRHKAWIQCARLAFGFAGIYDDDEAQRIVERNITDQATVVERQPLRDQVQRKSAVTVDAAQTESPAETVESTHAAGSLESFLNDVLSAPDTAELDAIAADAEKNLSGSALKAVKDAIKNRRDEMTKGEQP